MGCKNGGNGGGWERGMFTARGKGKEEDEGMKFNPDDKLELKMGVNVRELKDPKDRGARAKKEWR